MIHTILHIALVCASYEATDLVIVLVMKRWR